MNHSLSVSTGYEDYALRMSETTDYNKSRERKATGNTLRGHWLISTVDTLLLVFAALTHDVSLPFCTDGDLVLWS